MKSTNISFGFSYDDVLLVPQYSEIDSRSDVDLSTRITPRVKLSVPIISINMTDVTGVEMAIELGKLGGMGFLPRFETPENQANMVSKVNKAGVVVGAAIGCREGYLKRAEMLANAGVDILTLDVAHGGMHQAINATSQLKERFGCKIDIVSGVIGTYESACDLFKAGADSVRVGVGPGTICITRIQTGVGVPQITAVMEASRAAKKYNKTAICDGGTKNSGDMVKGLAAGAAAIITGSQFAGHDEAPGKTVVINGERFKTYNASTSPAEKNNHTKKLSGLGDNYTKHIEGIESLVPYKGPLKNTVDYMIANIKSGLSYCGAQNIPELWKKARFIQVSSMGNRESGAHDVIVR
jgi:IMP dehydrogenase